ncbi:MAG: 2-hydroxy-acid oxidase [Jatrophihabitans sp.]
MFRSGAAQQAAGASASEAPLRLAGAARRSFDQTSVTALDPLLRLFVTDMVAPYHLGLREDLLVDGAGHSFGEMAEPLIAELVPAGQPVELLVLAFSLHDLRLGRATATYLSHRCPGAPFAFAVCDQGVAAAFTGLRLIDAYARTGGCRRALLLVLEQSALHYELAVPAPVPTRHAGVGLLLDRDGGAELRPVRQHPRLAPYEVTGRLVAEVTALTGAREDVTLILGAGIEEEPAGLVAEVLRTPDGQPSTGPWWQLAGGLDRWADQQRLVILADYDRNLGYLSIAAADQAGATTLRQPAALAGAIPSGPGGRR